MIGRFRKLWDLDAAIFVFGFQGTFALIYLGVSFFDCLANRSFESCVRFLWHQALVGMFILAGLYGLFVWAKSYDAKRKAKVDAEMETLAAERSDRPGFFD